MENLENNNMQNKTIEKLTIILLVATLFIVGFNAFQFSKLGANSNIAATGNAIVETQQTEDNTANIPTDIDIIPRGVPNIYGKELGVSFDDVSSSSQQKADSTIKKIGVLDQQITLKGKELERYISIASRISCEYCCGAESIILSDGKAACGCAHSFAMRGLAKYLIRNHGSEYTDDAILEELGKWKTLFFPSKITEKARILKSKGIELNYINLASNKYRGVENGK